MAPVTTPKQNAYSRHNLIIPTNAQSRILTPEEQLRANEDPARASETNTRSRLSMDAKVDSNFFVTSRRPILTSPYGMDVYDDPDSPDMVATFELPGVARGDMKTEVNNGKFVLEGKRQLWVRPLSAQYTEWTYPEPPVALARSQSPAMSDDMQVDGSQDEGHRKAETSCGSEQGEGAAPRVVVSELRYGKFKREIQLPTGIEHKHITTTLSDGILKVTWPRHLSNQANNDASAVHDDPSLRTENNGPMVSQ
ncbi:hypothetical protein PQX77_016672 [Marasmius sp. AFHP31]|nr:hypothetical protein PQX77_016672 [Marasmius sp. AFHP31]